MYFIILIYFLSFSIKNAQLEQDKEQVLKSFNDKSVEFSKLSKEYQDLLQDYNTIKNSLKEFDLIESKILFSINFLLSLSVIGVKFVIFA